MEASVRPSPALTRSGARGSWAWGLGLSACLSAEPPSMRLKARPGSPGFSVLTCSAFSFYPPELQLRFLRNGLAVGSGEGDFGPNGDGSFHAWSSLTVKSGDEHHYRCVVQHAGLPQPLTVELGKVPGRPDTLCLWLPCNRLLPHCCRSAFPAAAASLTIRYLLLPVVPQPQPVLCESDGLLLCDCPSSLLVRLPCTLLLWVPWPVVLGPILTLLCKVGVFYTDLEHQLTGIPSVHTHSPKT